MKKVFTLVLLAAGLFVATPKTQAQIKIGYISLGDVIQAMPEAKKADSSLVQYRDALYQNAEEKRNQLEKDIASPEVRATLEENFKLAEDMGMNGTPSYVIGKQVVVGAVGLDGLKEKIGIARCGKATC